MNSQIELNLAKEIKIEIFFLPPIPIIKKRKNKKGGEKRQTGI